MSLADLVQQLVDAGATPQMIAIAVRAVEEAGAPKPRSAGAVRQERYRAKIASQSVTCDVTSDAQVTNSDVTERHSVPPPPPPIDNITLTPPSTPSISVGRASASNAVDRLMGKAFSAKSSSDAFLRFWQAYPHKVGKPDAARSFFKVAGEAAAILEGLERYIRAKPADRPWLNPSTFLNQRRWEDAPATTTGSQNVQRIGAGKGSLVEAGQRLIRELDERAEQSMRPEGFGPPRDNDAVLLPFFGGQRS